MNLTLIPQTNIEYVFHGPPASPKKPIILVHGAYNNADVWEDNFLSYFAEKGHPVYAICLKEQKKLPRFAILFSYRLKDYVKRLGLLIDTMGQKPVLIGHSMGGLVIQRYLSEHTDRVAGACLLAALPWFGMKHTILKMLLQPIRFLAYMILTLNPAVARKGPPPVGLLSKRADKKWRKRIPQVIVRESGFALFDALFFPHVKPEKVKKTPLLIFGAEYDHLALPEDVVKNGEMYQAETIIYPKMGHFMMMEPEWEEIAGKIFDRFLGNER